MMDGNPPAVDINHASLEELTGLPGLKQKMAERVIAGRPYETLDDLRQVKALPAGLLESLRPYLTVSPADAAGPYDPSPAEKSPADEMVSEGSPVSQPIVDATVTEEPGDLWSVEKSTTDEMVSEGSPVQQPIMEAGVTEESDESFADEKSTAGKMVGEGMPIPQPVLNEAAPVEIEPEVPSSPDAEPVPTDGTAQTIFEPGLAQPAEAPAPRPLSTGRLIGCGALMGVAALVLSVAVTLLLLLAINGSLSFATYNQYAALSRQEQDLSSQVSGIQQDVTAMQARLAAVETLSGRVGSLETDQQTLRSNLQTSQQQLEAAQTQLNQLGGRITQIEQRSQAFSQFIEGLRSLVSQIPTTQP